MISAGYSYTESDFDFNAVRLCFQVFLKSSKDENVLLKKPLPVLPVVSNIVYDKKYVADLSIHDISDTSSPTIGGKKILIFCDKVLKNDIKIRFYREGKDNSVEWEAWGHSYHVHSRVAIAFKTPAYVTNDIDEPVNVLLQLVRPSDGRRSKPLYFRYDPDYSTINHTIKNKKRKIAESEALFQYVQEMKSVQGWEDDQRNAYKTNINPRTESNQVSYNGASQMASQTASQTNFISNFLCDDQLYNDPKKSTESYQFQQSDYSSQRCPQNSIRTQHHSTHNSYNTQSQQTAMNFTQPLHSHVQHSDFQPQQKTNHFEHQPLSQPEYRANPTIPNLNQQLPPNGYQQYSYGENLCSSVTYNPFADYYRTERAYDSTLQPFQHVNEFSVNNSATIQEPNFCENNFSVEDIEKMTRNSFV